MKLKDEAFIQLISIETLSMMPTAGIIQISGCRFSIKDKKIVSTIQINIKPSESKLYNLDINPDTVNFWLSQPSEIKTLLHIDAVSLANGIDTLYKWIESTEKLIYYPTFTIPVLTNAINKLNNAADLPWNHYNTLDLQTIFLLSNTRIEKVSPRNSLKQCELFANKIIELFNED